MCVGDMCLLAKRQEERQHMALGGGPSFSPPLDPLGGTTGLHLVRAPHPEPPYITWHKWLAFDMC